MITSHTITDCKMNFFLRKHLLSRDPPPSHLLSMNNCPELRSHVICAYKTRTQLRTGILLRMASCRLLLVLSALVGVAKASDSSWTTTYNDDGTVIISSSRGGPTAVVTLERNGARVATSFQDCAVSTPNSVCRKGNGIISEVSSGFSCVNNKIYSEEPVNGDLTLSVTINTTGHLYGGPEQINQYWPLDDVHFDDYSYVTKQQDNQGIADPYWLSSDGYFIFIDPKTSLFIEQNLEYDHYIKFIARNSDPYPSPAILWHEFTLCEFDDAKQAHMFAVENFLGKPSDIPDFRMIVHPIWSTWARYKVNINEDVVQEFADEIIRYGFENSQLEIDDDWETCYGSLTFDKTKFPDMKGLTDRLKQQGYRVTLWIHPFINLDCDPYHQEAQDKGYFVKNADGNTTSTWWNGVASAIDFTNPEAVEWWVGRLKAMQGENGIDSFKFDAGETSWLPQIPVLTGDLQLQPNLHTERYVNTVAQFGDMVEVRVGHHTQTESIFVRMLDKDSRWDIVNGLPTLITTLLEMNMVGYPLVLPDMVGGNGYNGAPSKELFIRWLEANVFMPAIQYSYVPWDYDNETVEICQKYTNLHADYAPRIIELLKRSVIDGTPLNPPIWWIDPKDETAQEISDEFLLGEDILVAPVIVEGAVTRDIYLPRGVWKDEATPANSLIIGPVWLRDYPAPLNVLPYFTRQPYLTG